MADGWKATREALGKFREVLLCSKCERVISKPSILATCRHEFCRECIANSGMCPTCASPYWKKDILPYTVLQSLVSYMETIETLISIPTPANIETTPTIPTTVTKPIVSTVTTPTVHTMVTPTVPTVATPTVATALKPVNCRWTKRKRSETNSLNNKRNAKGETQLQVAVIKGNINKVKELLEDGANPNVTDNAGWTPLHEACNHGYKNIVELLISYGSLLNTPGDNNETPLHDAVSNNHIDIVSTLIKHGANTSLRNCQGQTPLDLASTQEMRNALSAKPATVSSPPVKPNGSDTLIILGSGLKPCNRSLMTKTVERLRRSKIASEFNTSVTHVLTECNEEKCCSRTMKCLSAVAKGCWLLSFEWLTVSSSEGYWVKEEDYVIKGFHYEGKSWVTAAPSKGYYNAIEKCPGLFDGLEFYIDTYLTSPQPTRTDLKTLIELAGGKVLLREPKSSTNEKKFPFHASTTSPRLFSECNKIIITNPSPSPSAKALSLNTVLTSVSWVLDCLSHFKLIEYY